MSDETLFPEPQTKNCIRCGIRCKTVPKRNPNAGMFVKGDMRTGRFCANCLVVDFFKNCDTGPSSSMGDWYFDDTKPIPDWERGPIKRFDPECLRLPHIQEQWTRIVMAAQQSYGAELTPEEIDWDEVIANWHLPFPKKQGRSGPA